MKRFLKVFFAVLLLAVLTFPNSVAYASNKEKADISESKSAVVRVFAEYDDGSCATGSAFGVGKAGTEPEYFVTNAHVCLDDNGKQAKKIYILLDNKAVHLKYDNTGAGGIDDINYSKMVACMVVNEKSISLFPDVAVLKTAKPISGRTCIPLHETSKNLKDASTVYALGFPGVSDFLSLSRENSTYIAAEVDEVNLTSGVVSKKTNSELYHNTDIILHSAAISNGNSGGPLIDDSGAVVGINTYLLDSSSDQFVSIYIDYAVSVLEEEGIEFENADIKDKTKNTVLLCVIAVTVVLATALIMVFKKRSTRYVENLQARELRIQGVAGVFNGRRFPLEGQVSIGRAPDNSLVFPTDTPGVGSHHCVIIRNGGQIYIKDLGSTYGTAINGNQRIDKNQLVSLRVGDRIALGSEQQAFMITYKGGKLRLDQ